MLPRSAIAIAMLLGAATLHGATPPLSAEESDPVRMGWMVGSPPPPDRIIRYEDDSYFRFPMTRWSFSHMRELVPAANVPRGDGPVAALPRAERSDLDSVTFLPIGASRTMTWKESLAANYTDGIVVLHRGRIVYEKYFGALSGDRQHIAFSTTKSFFGTIAAALIVEGKLDPTATVGHYLPELKDSGFADATLGQVLDMTTALDYDEHYDSPQSKFYDWWRAIAVGPRPAGFSGPRNEPEYLATVRRDGAHGKAFVYRSINTAVLGWVIARVSGKRADEVLTERLWSRLGMEGDGAILVDSIGTPLAAGGLNARLRDMARFGEMIRLNGRFNGQQVMPAAAIEDIRRGASPEAFATAGYKTLPGWSYHRQWWVSHDDHGTFMARGIHGQAIYIDPAAEMVIARFASHPLAGNVNLDPTSLPAYRAVADFLMAHPR